MNRFEYEHAIVAMAASLTDQDRRKFIDVLQSESQNPVALFGWNIWGGYFGADRFLLGDYVKAILKLITFGGLGLWVFIDCFSVGGRTRARNFEKAQFIFSTLRRREALRE